MEPKVYYYESHDVVRVVELNDLKEQIVAGYAVAVDYDNFDDDNVVVVDDDN